MQETEPNLGTLLTIDVPQLVESMPADGSPKVEFSQRGEDWLFNFSFVSVSARFSAIGVGRTPFEAFSIAKQVLERQVREWHHARKDGLSNEVFVAPSSPLTNVRHRPLTALIIDDDVDTAMALESIFRQLGCVTEMITRPELVHRKISSIRADLIVLDWRLGDKLLGGQAVERATRFIETFSDLRTIFEGYRPKVITYSALPYADIHFPETQYFDHVDHWQKPIDFSELAKRSAELVKSEQPQRGY